MSTDKEFIKKILTGQNTTKDDIKNPSTDDKDGTTYLMHSADPSTKDSGIIAYNYTHSSDKKKQSNNK